MRLGIMLPNWIGDVTMATPALRALRKHFADAELIGFVRPYVADVLSGSRWLDRLVPWEHRGWRNMPGNLQTAWKLRGQSFDAIVLLRNSLISAAVARLSGARTVAGVERLGDKWLLTDVLRMPRRAGKVLPVSAVDRYLELAYLMGCPPEPRELELHTTPQDELTGGRILELLGLTEDQPIIMLNTGGAYGGAKHWPTKHGAELARRAATELGLHVLVNCGPTEYPAAEEIVHLAAHPHVQSLAHLPSPLRGIGPSKALIRRMQLMVSTDSGPRHLAAALGVPTITLFGPIDPAWSTNYQPGSVDLRVDLPCSPCGKRVCPLKHQRCMQDLSVDRVFAALQRKLASHSQRVAA
jgi:heptosyltransferase II